MPPAFERTPERSELVIVRVDNKELTDTYLLYPSDSTDEELETRWIRAEKSDFICLDEIR